MVVILVGVVGVVAYQVGAAWPPIVFTSVAYRLSMTTATIMRQFTNTSPELSIETAERYMTALRASPGGQDASHPCRMLADHIASKLRVAALSGQQTIDVVSAVNEVVTLSRSLDGLVIDLRDRP